MSTRPSDETQSTSWPLSSHAKSTAPSKYKYYHYDQDGDNPMLPLGPIGLIDMIGTRDLAEAVNHQLHTRRLQYMESNLDFLQNLPGFLREDYRLSANCPRFATGEGRAELPNTVRGHDLYILCDVLNYAVTYPFYGLEKPMSPDEHYQDLKRIILAASGKARRINVIMPFLYSGRQHKRNARESLDCAFMLEELAQLGVANFLTFDAHDPRVANASPILGFENVMAIYQIIKAMKREMPELHRHNDRFMVIAPDEGAMDRAMYFARMLDCPIGTFFKRRDYTRVVDGRNPIISHEFLGEDARGLSVLIVDDMIASGDSMLDIAREMKARHAERVYCTATFALFTSGLDRFNQAYQDGIINRLFATNLTYRSPELLASPWYIDVDLSKYIALIIDALNHDASLSDLLDPSPKIAKLLAAPQENASAIATES